MSNQIIAGVSATVTAGPPGSAIDFTETLCCHRGTDGTQHYALRIAALFAILGSSAIGGLLPWICRALRLESFFFFCAVFAGGVLLATGLVHILPEASAYLSDPCLHLSSNFPWAFVICGAALVLTFTIEYYLRAIIRRLLSKQYNLNADLETGMILSHDFSALTELGIGSYKEASLIQRAQIRDQKVAAIMLEAGIVFHSFFIGLDIGANSKNSAVRSLMIAMIVQQGFEGLALGATFIRAHFKTSKYFLYLSLFVLIAPIGIAIGIGISKVYNDNSKVALGVQGAFNAASAGILLYNGLVDILLPAFTSKRLLIGRLLWRVVATCCLLTGYGLMALLAKWA